MPNIVSSMTVRLKTLISINLLKRKLISERLKAHLTQQEVAKKMGMTQSVLARIEGGVQLPSMKTIERYASALGKFPEMRFKAKRSSVHK